MKEDELINRLMLRQRVSQEQLDLQDSPRSSLPETPESSYVTPLPVEPVVLHKNRETLEVYTWQGWTLRLEKVKCGKPTCKTCPHGPYWYAYRRQGNKTVSKYIGKRLRLDRLESENTTAF
ncbi:MAG: hypothetical protein ACK8QZ_12720 [Anaerolineales bacterium]